MLVFIRVENNSHHGSTLKRIPDFLHTMYPHFDLADYIIEIWQGVCLFCFCYCSMFNKNDFVMSNL